ncbi:membrane protein [Adhaeribacter aerolatus]|uniref:Membrane protein n=1 Tax=Adhaeribacter aerolatus TaxID=670289 RepID=A0A512B053_9BACT|nr:BamA/TamA family outer membrane protein [Adhaeribacter aerolatus]GEO05339.1 membrane protein [Adhaeribacter aerolatus]
MKYTWVVLCFLCLLQVNGWAAGAPVDSLQHRKKLSLTPFPALFSSPETGLGYGALVVPVYNFGNDSLTRSSNGQLLAYRTQKKQSSVQLTYNIYTNHEKFIVLGNANYFNFPIQYYGTGNQNNQVDDYTILDYKMLYSQNRVLRQVKRYFFAGGLYHLNKVYDIKSDDPLSKIYERPANELDGVITSGLGPALLYDSRDNPLNSRTGIYAAYSTMFSNKSLGSEFNFVRHALDVRKFIPLRASQVLALQGLGKFHSGQVPFRELALMGGGGGGAEIGGMRGFYEGRYRDRQMVALQAEFRQQVFSRVGFVVFAGAGEVSNKLSNFNTSNLRSAAGGGIRLMLNKKERLNIRIDYAVGSHGASGLYFDIGEDF